MKTLIAFFLLFSVGCCLIGAPSAVAAEGGRDRHISTGRILEFSLSRLKESVDKAAQKNDRLAFENEMLRKSIYDLQQEKEFLLGKKRTLSTGLSAADYEKMRLASIETFDVGEREQRTKELIGIFQRDIMRLKKEVYALEAGLDEEKRDVHREALLGRMQESEKSLIQAEKRLKSLEKRNKGPKEKIGTLKAEQIDLLREIERLQYGFRRF